MTKNKVNSSKTGNKEKSADSKLSPNTYIVIDDYFPDDSGALAVSAGQKVELIDDYGGKASKKLRIESKDELDLLDNSAAKHKISIRPKRNHPDPRSRGHSMHEERWLVKDLESGQQGLVPSRLLGAPPPGTVLATSIKRSLQEMSSEESTEAKRKVTKELKDIKSSKMRKSAGRLLGPSPEEEAMIKRTATIKELIETEEEFVRDLEFVVRNYYALFDEELTPKYIRDQKDTIFGNFKFIADFHQNVLIEGVKYHANVPNLIGKTFLRLERDFDKHSEYCTTEPVADEYLEKNQKIKDYFEEFSEGIGDDKRLGEHLKLPIQRLNDYQLLLKEIIKFSNRLGDETTDLEKAHDLMQTIPQRATDAKFLASIEGFKGNLFKLGRLIRHDWFSVSEEGHKTRDRYLFLFKARILVTKVKRITDERSIFILRDIIRLPETSLCGLERPTVLEFHHIEPQNHPNYPIVLDAKTQDIRDAWLHIVKEHVIDTASVDDLLFDDEIRVVSDEAEEEELGHISPSAEGADLFEELPEDSELYQVVPDKKGVEIPITKVTSDEPVSLKEQLHIEEEFVFATETSGKVIPIEIEKEETIRDIPITRESEQKLKFESVQDLDTSIKRALDREEEEDFWATETYSPPPKRRVTSPLSEFQDSTVDFVPEFKTENQIIKEIKVEEREELDLWSKREISPPPQRTTSYQSSNEPVPIVEEPISPINKSYKEVEEVLETQEDFEIWGTKERSPPPKKRYSLPPVEDTVLIEEEPTSLVLKEQKETYIELETEKEPNLNKEEHLDFWSVKETSTSKKVFEIQTEKESGVLSDIKEEEFDFWGKKASSPKPKAKEQTTQEELDLGAKETSSPSFPETKQPETNEEELDFWAKQPSSPIPKAKEPITQEEELDFWAKPSSSPTSKAEQQETKEEVDFWAKQPSSTSPNTEQQETKEELDFWAKQPSSPRPKTEQQQTQEEELEFWAKQSASLSPKAEQQETQEEELDIWAKQPLSPIIKAKEPTTQEEELDFWTKQPSSPSPKAEQQETKEEELDFWAKQPSSPTPKAEQPETKEEELDFWSKQPSSPSPKAEQQETKEEELDFWANKPSSPTPKTEQPEKKEEELDFWSKEPSSPSSKEEKSTIKTEVAFEKTDEPSKAPESISQKSILEITSKEQKEKEEAVDFWSTRESSPPLRKRSVPALKDYSTPTYPEVCQDQEDINLEQVEISVFKAEEKVAEQKQDFTLQTKEEEEEGTTFKEHSKRTIHEKQHGHNIEEGHEIISIPHIIEQGKGRDESTDEEPIQGEPYKLEEKENELKPTENNKVDSNSPLDTLDLQFYESYKQIKKNDSKLLDEILIIDSSDLQSFLDKNGYTLMGDEESKQDQSTEQILESEKLKSPDEVKSTVIDSDYSEIFDKDELIKDFKDKNDSLNKLHDDKDKTKLDNIIPSTTGDGYNAEKTSDAIFEDIWAGRESPLYRRQTPLSEEIKKRENMDEKGEEFSDEKIISTQEESDTDKQNEEIAALDSLLPLSDNKDNYNIEIETEMSTKVSEFENIWNCQTSPPLESEQQHFYKDKGKKEKKLMQELDKNDDVKNKKSNKKCSGNTQITNTDDAEIKDIFTRPSSPSLSRKKSCGKYLEEDKKIPSESKETHLLIIADIKEKRIPDALYDIVQDYTNDKELPKGEEALVVDDICGGRTSPCGFEVGQKETEDFKLSLGKHETVLGEPIQTQVNKISNQTVFVNQPDSQNDLNKEPENANSPETKGDNTKPDLFVSLNGARAGKEKEDLSLFVKRNGMNNIVDSKCKAEPEEFEFPDIWAGRTSPPLRTKWPFFYQYNTIDEGTNIPLEEETKEFTENSEHNHCQKDQNEEIIEEKTKVQLGDGDDSVVDECSHIELQQKMEITSHDPFIKCENIISPHEKDISLQLDVVSSFNKPIVQQTTPEDIEKDWWVDILAGRNSPPLRSRQDFFSQEKEEVEKTNRESKDLIDFHLANNSNIENFRIADSELMTESIGIESEQNVLKN